jgi:hypothetical protein
MADCCENGNGRSGSVTGGKFVDWLATVSFSAWSK